MHSACPFLSHPARLCSDALTGEVCLKPLAPKSDCRSPPTREAQSLPTRETCGTVAQVSDRVGAGAHTPVRRAQPCGLRGRLGLLLSLRTLTCAGSLCRKHVPAREMRFVAPAGKRGSAGAVRSMGELFCTPVAVQNVTMALHGPTSRVAAS